MLLVLLNCLTESTFPSPSTEFNPHITMLNSGVGGGGGGGGVEIPGPPPPPSMKPCIAFKEELAKFLEAYITCTMQLLNSIVGMYKKKS